MAQSCLGAIPPPFPPPPTMQPALMLPSSPRYCHVYNEQYCSKYQAFYAVKHFEFNGRAWWVLPVCPQPLQCISEIL